MKKNITNCLATTGLSLILLAAVAVCYRASLLCIETIFQVAAANAVIHWGIAFLKRFESRYFIIEILVELGYITAVLVAAGAVFGWYTSTPVWILVLMGVAVYMIGGVIDVLHIRSDVELINVQLKRRKEQGIKKMD